MCLQGRVLWREGQAEARIQDLQLVLKYSRHFSPRGLRKQAPFPSLVKEGLLVG